MLYKYSNFLAGGSDYLEISAVAREILLTFDQTNRLHFFNVTIMNDSLFESDTEHFALELRFDPFEHERPSNVTLRPNVSVVNILDIDVDKIPPSIHLEPTRSITTIIDTIGRSIP
jgi:hypothetical protein